MSKKKDFEYSGKLNEVKQTDDDLKRPNSPNHQPSNQPPASNSNSNHDKDRESNGDSLNSNSPDVRQHNDDLENNGIRPHPSNEDDKKDANKGEQQAEGNSNQPNDNQSNDDLKNSNDENSNNNSDEDRQNENDPQSNSDNNTDSGNEEDIENSTMKDESLSDSGSLIDDDDIKQKDDNDSDNDVEQTDDDSSDDSKVDDDSLKDKALNKIDPNLAKASKLKDLSQMNKEQAKEELVQVTKSMAKKKIVATLSTYLLPIILPIIGIIAVLALFFLIMMTAMNIIQNEEKQQEGCSVVDKQSSNISDSKDAEKNAMNIYKYTKEHVKGSTNKGIAAWLGNIHEESGGTFSSSTIQGGSKYKESLAKDPSAGGYAFGFAQMDSERRVKLIEYAEKKDKKWSDMETQLEYILNHDSTDSDLIKKLVKKDDDIASTTETIMNDWERAGAKDSLPKRQAAAKKYYSKISKEDGDSDSNIEDATSAASDNSDAGSNSGCNTDSKSKTDGELGDSVKANDGSGKVLKQWDSKDDIPEKYKKHIQLPDYKGEKLDSSENIFPATGNKGQCTELVFSYMSQLWKGKQPTNGNGNVIYKAYKSQGAKTTSNPTVGYGFSSNPPYAGATTSDVGHTGVVIGVMDDGKWLMSNYNLNGEANKDESRVETFALVDGNKKDGGITFFSGVGKPKIKSK